MPGLLQNHIAVITGAASGIGRGIALGFAREGAQVAVLDINSDGRRKDGGGHSGRRRQGEGLHARRHRSQRLPRRCGESGERGRRGLDPGQQRGHQPAQRLYRRRRCRDQGLAGHHGDQPQRRVQRDARVRGRAARQQGAHRQYRVDPVVHACAHAELAGLHHLQARRARLYPRARRRAGQGRRARQRHRPGLHRDAAERESARHQSGAGEDLPRSHPARPHRQAGGHRRARRFSSPPTFRPT